MIRVLVDSSSDYDMDELKEKGIELIPIKITLGGNEYIEGVNLKRDDLYGLMDATGEFSKTSQPSPYEFRKIFEDVKEKGDEMICILLSSELSGTCQSAVIAKNMVDYDDIYIIDSRSATVCIKVMADYAVKLIRENKTVKKIVEMIEKLKSKVKCIATIDTLEYLHRGGRLGKAAATLGSAANIKPIITLDERGKVSILKKSLGKKQAIIQMKKILNSIKINEEFPIYSIFSSGTKNSEMMEEKLESEGYTFKERLQIGPTIGAHIGPGAFGVILVEA